MSTPILSQDITQATRWSVVTQVVIKIIAPITNMILARLLSPEAFGVVATATMVFSFADTLTDAGFQKYLVQHEFVSDEEKKLYCDVAFLANLIFSVALLATITLFRGPIAVSVGIPGLGNVIAVACLPLIISSFSSIQMALYRRALNFEGLFYAQLFASLVSFSIVIPLALLGFSYWSIIMGTMVGELARTIVLTRKSRWKPRVYFDFAVLRSMLSFSVWALIESVMIWLTAWVDIFFIGSSLGVYQLGLYKTSINLVNSLFALITASFTPVLFSSLSRLQNDQNLFNSVFLKYQRMIAYLVLPMGVGLFLLKDPVTVLLLGPKWADAGSIVGIWSLTSALTIGFSQFFSVVYRAKGHPKVSVANQLFHLLFLIPTCLVGVQLGFWPLVYLRALIRLQVIPTSIMISHLLFHLELKAVLNNLLKPLILTVITGLAAWLFVPASTSFVQIALTVLTFGVFYIVLLSLVARSDMDLLVNMFFMNNRLARKRVGCVDAYLMPAAVGVQEQLLQKNAPHPCDAIPKGPHE